MKKAGICFVITLFVVIVPSLILATQSTPRCLIIFVGGYKDNETRIMKSLWEDNKNIFGCETAYHAHTQYYEIAETIKDYKGAITVVGHSLGGSTALAFGDNGAEHVVTLQQFPPVLPPLVSSVIQGY